MRTIKFRAWNVETKEFELPLYRGVVGLDINAILRGSTLIYQQYTGLKDKNGKEIYEGDVLEAHRAMFGPLSAEKQRNEVRFEDGAFKVATVNLSILTEDMPNGLSFYPEIIGNIYETPDLITPNEQ